METDTERENRLRRSLRRRGFVLHKSRRRDPGAWDFGTYQVLDFDRNLVAGDSSGYGMTLDAVEAWLDLAVRRNRGPAEVIA